MKTVRDTDITGQRGIALIHSVVTEMGSLWHPTGFEAGLDGFIEFRDPTTGEMLNQHLAVQSKATATPFPGGNPTFTCREKDLEYWLKGNMPVALVYCHPDSGQALWVSIRDYFSDPAKRKARKITFDRERDRFDSSALPRLLEKAVDRSSGVYLAPPPSPEPIISNLQKVIRLPGRLFHGYTDCRSGKEVRELLNQYGGADVEEWVYRGRTVLSPEDLSEGPWRQIIDSGTVEDFDTSEWASSVDHDRRSQFIDLLGQCLRTKLRRLHVRFERDGRYYHFTATHDMKPRVVGYESLRQPAHREVFKLYQKKVGDQILRYYRHNAFRGRFRHYDGQWYLQIDPTYRFTSDGRTVHPIAASLLSGIRKLERNAAVLGQVVMWASLLRDPDPQDLFAASPYPHLGFGELVQYESPVGIQDQAWTASEEGTGPLTGSVDGETLEFEFYEVGE